MIRNLPRHRVNSMVLRTLAVTALFVTAYLCGEGNCVNPALAQDADTPDLQCLRYVQSYERSMQVPLGLLTAISFVEAGRPGTDGKTVAWPWTINVGGQGRFFDTKEQAVAETRKLLDEGVRSIDVGCMQINLRYHPTAFHTLEDAFDPATNVAYGAQYLKSLHDLQGSWPKAVERYHSSEDNQRTDYREKVLAFWNNEARALLMDTVATENTNTPYHHALRYFASGQFAEALDTYQSIVDGNGKDRIGLLGLAMSYEKLGRVSESRMAYIRYLAIEPTNESVAAHLLQDIMSQQSTDARADLEQAVKAGIQRPDFLSALAEAAGATGDNETASTYAIAAVQQAPKVAMYNLNAAVFADRLKRKTAAIGYYAQFLELFSESPVVIDTSIDSVRQRLKYLQAQL